MKLIKCRKCGATVMTADTLLSTMQEEYGLLATKYEKANNSARLLILQRMSQLKKLMTAVCHSSTEAEIKTKKAYNELRVLKRYVIDHGIMNYEQYESEIEAVAKEITLQKEIEAEKEIERLYGEFENKFCNKTKKDPTVKEALKGEKDDA